MKLTVDPTADALYLTLGNAKVEETRQVAPGVMLDYDTEGRVVGIEVLSISTKATPAELSRLPIEPLAPKGSSAPSKRADWTYSFWENASAEEYARRQGVEPIREAAALYGQGEATDWEGFDEAVEKWRSEGPAR